MAARYLKTQNPDLFSTVKLIFEKATTERACLVREDKEIYQIRPAKKKLDYWITFRIDQTAGEILDLDYEDYH